MAAFKLSVFLILALFGLSAAYSFTGFDSSNGENIPQAANSQPSEEVWPPQDEEPKTQETENPSPASGSCSDPDASCPRGEQCVGPSGSQECRTPVGNNGRCEHDQYSVCEEGLECVGPSESKRCKKPMGPGGRCGVDPFWVCSEGLDCVDNVCKTPVSENGDCSASNTVCQDETSCVGPEGRQRCKTLMGEGGRCGNDPFWVCAEELTCVSGQCLDVIPESGACTQSSTCIEDTQCVGPAGNQKCKTPMTENERCGQDPFWVCAEGLECVGPQNAQLCAIPSGPGEECGITPFSVCLEGLVCENSICLNPVPENGDCTPANSACQDDTECVGPDNRKRCKTLMTENERCGQDPFWVCAEGLECVGPQNAQRCAIPSGPGEECGITPFSVCLEGLVCENSICLNPVPENGDCTPANSACQDDTECVGPDNRKRCTTPIDEGGECGTDQFLVCTEGLTCSEGRCRNIVPVDGDCSATNAICEAESECVGPNNRRRCIIPRQDGERCLNDAFTACAEGLECVGPDNETRCRVPSGPGEKCGTPFFVCIDGLVCENSICQNPVPRNGACTAANSACQDDTECVGPNSRQRCKTPMNEGERCGSDPYWVCAEGLTCVNRKCRNVVALNGDCTTTGSICEEGTDCVGTDSRKKCKELMQEGERCGQDPFWVCEEGLHCVGPASAQRCKVPSGPGEKCGTPFFVCEEGLECENSICLEAAPLNGSCDPERTACPADTHCVGNPRNRRCKTPVDEGGRCDVDPLWVCAEELTCVNKRCRLVVPKDGDCTQAGTTCEEGTQCVGPNNRKRCKTPMEIGGRCDTDPFWVCAEGLTCVSNVCRNVVPAEGNCTPAGTTCEEGSQCVGRTGNMKCKVPMREGGRCDVDPFWVCADDLSCVNGRCANIVPVNGDCTPSGTSCTEGSNCVGPEDRRRCVTPQEENEQCGDEEFLFCGDGLSCVDNICLSSSRRPSDRCGPKQQRCTGRTECAGPRGRERCVTPMTVGKKCEVDPYWVCEEGLTCKSKRCIK